MFFILSKTVGFFALPSNALISLGLLGALLLRTRFAPAGRRLLVASVLLLAIVGWSPLGNALILMLEQRFPAWDASRGAPDGIVVLGGAIAPYVSGGRGVPVLNEAAERLTAAVELARRYPAAKIVFSGGSGALFLSGERPEAEYAQQLLESLGVERGRIRADGRSRNTDEDAIFSRETAAPQPGERWLLVTSAYHMPRAIGAFRRAGFAVEAHPVDWRTHSGMDALHPFASLGDGLRRTDTAVREWVGLLAYRITGRSAELIPSP
jgi:uncharacterized SAM-binding protein YcdF (DUF218 family)